MHNYDFLDKLLPEAHDFTQAELAEIERSCADSLRRYYVLVADDKEMLTPEKIEQITSSCIRTAVNVVIRNRANYKAQEAIHGVKAMEQKPKTDSTPTPPPQTTKHEPKPKKADVIQLSLALPERARPVSNVTVRAALFAAIQGENRELLNKATLTSQNGIRIIFSGEQLNQDDHDVFMQLVSMAIHKPLGEDMTVPANAILAELGRGKGGKDHEQLKNDIHRLVTGTVNIKFDGINFIGHLIDYAIQDETLPTHKRHWTYQLNPKIAALFGRTQYTLIDWEQRKKLKQKDLARWLMLYYATHSKPYPVSVEFLWKLCGSKTKELRKFRQNLKIALDALVEIGFITSWRIDEKDLVHVERLASVTQLQPPTPPTKALPTPPTVSQYSYERHLQPITIERFRKLYPNLDPYACNADFQFWLQGKTAPENYDVAFLGFAKKWVKGKF
jgi:hypothetical protein